MQMFQNTDVDNSGSLDYEEFVAGAAGRHKPGSAPPQALLRLPGSAHPPRALPFAATVNINLLDREEVFLKAFQQMDKVRSWSSGCCDRAH